jgi:hypothetical protein
LETKFESIDSKSIYFANAAFSERPCMRYCGYKLKSVYRWQQKHWEQGDSLQVSVVCAEFQT